MNRNEAIGDEAYEARNDRTGGDIPSGNISDNTYAVEKGPSGAPQVVRDENVEEDPIDPRTSSSNEQLMRDDREAIDKGNIIGSRTRGAGKGMDYTEPGDTEGLPGMGDSGSSSLRTGGRI